jgi:DNA-binding FadR family transcriptional regulator
VLSSEPSGLDPAHPPTAPVRVVADRTSLRDHIYRALPEIDRAEAITNRLRDSMALGLLVEGDRLPSELEMADSFGVSPTTVRDALAVLRAEGLVDTRRGRHGGTFVVSLPAVATDAMRQRLAALSVVELRDMGDHRAAVSSASARLAASRAVEGDLTRFRRLLDAFISAPDAAAMARADSRIWLELAVMAQSRRLLAVQLQLQLEVGELLWAPIGSPRDRGAALDPLLQLAEAIERRDAEAAALATSRRISADTFHMIDQKLTLALHGDQEDESHDRP